MDLTLPSNHFCNNTFEPTIHSATLKRLTSCRDGISFCPLMWIHRGGRDSHYYRRRRLDGSCWNHTHQLSEPAFLISPSVRYPLLPVCAIHFSQCALVVQVVASESNSPQHASGIRAPPSNAAPRAQRWLRGGKRCLGCRLGGEASERLRGQGVRVVTGRAKASKVPTQGWLEGRRMLCGGGAWRGPIPPECIGVLYNYST